LEQDFAQKTERGIGTRKIKAFVLGL